MLAVSRDHIILTKLEIGRQDNFKRRAQNEKSKEYFSVVWRAERAVAGLTSLVGVLLKECSNFVKKTPPGFTFIEIERKEVASALRSPVIRPVGPQPFTATVEISNRPWPNSRYFPNIFLNGLITSRKANFRKSASAV